MSAVVAGCDVVSGWVVHTASDSTAREWSAVWLFANELSGHGFNILVFHPPLILMALAALRSVAVRRGPFGWPRESCSRWAASRGVAGPVLSLPTAGERFGGDVKDKSSQVEEDVFLRLCCCSGQGPRFQVPCSSSARNSGTMMQAPGCLSTSCDKISSRVQKVKHQTLEPMVCVSLLPFHSSTLLQPLLLSSTLAKYFVKTS